MSCTCLGHNCWVQKVDIVVVVVVTLWCNCCWFVLGLWSFADPFISLFFLEHKLKKWLKMCWGGGGGGVRVVQYFTLILAYSHLYYHLLEGGGGGGGGTTIWHAPHFFELGHVVGQNKWSECVSINTVVCTCIWLCSSWLWLAKMCGSVKMCRITCVYMQPLNFISDQSIDFAAPWWADSFFQKILPSRIVGV